MTPRVGLSLAVDDGFRAATSPLFEAGVVDVIEWSFDVEWAFGENPTPPPEWVSAVCDLYSNAGRLYGHGVALSALSAQWEERQERWIEYLAREVTRRHYVHVSEHMGFMSARGFHPGAPLPVPMTDEAIAAGRYALGRLADVVGAPVGLENLAPAFALRDVEDQGAFIDALVSPQDGFLLLDLHNIYCQSYNLGISMHAILERMPLARVREIHVSGGSFWQPAVEPTRALRADTHNGPVPAEVMNILPYALRACPNVEAVFLERIGETLHGEGDSERFRRDFTALRVAVERARRPMHPGAPILEI